jgi:hypothetical protein
MADLSRDDSSGGQNCTNANLSAATDLLIYAGGGRLTKVQVTTGGWGTGLCRIYDSATTSGAVGAQLIYAMAQTTTGSVGMVLDLQIPFANGIVCARTTNGPGVTINWNTANVLGR